VIRTCVRRTSRDDGPVREQPAIFQRVELRVTKVGDPRPEAIEAMLQYVCRYLVISIFSGSVPTAVEKSMNFWNSALCLSVSSPAMK
jgi:hypothetical protein